MNLRLFLLIGLTGSFLAACTSQKAVSYDQALAQSSMRSEAELTPSELSAERHLLYSAEMRLQVDQPDSVQLQLQKLAESYEGYVQSAAHHEVVLRVKQPYLDAALDQIATFGKVEARHLRAQDVTEDFLDFQIRLENAQKARDRYLQLLAEAQNVEEALLVERELERLNGVVDELKGKLNRLSHLEAFATITVDLQEKVKPGLVGYLFVGLYQGVKWLFVRN